MREKRQGQSQNRLSPFEARIFAKKDAKSSLLKTVQEHLLPATSVGELLERANYSAINLFFSKQFASVVSEHSPYIQRALRDNPSPYRRQNEEKSRLFNALTQHNFEGVPQDSQTYIDLLYANAYKEQIARTLIREAITNPNNELGLTPVQKITLFFGTHIADVVDNAHLAWYKELNQGETFQFLNEVHNTWEANNKKAEAEGRPNDVTHEDPAWKLVEPSLGKDPGDYLYVMPRINEETGAIDAVPYSQAFPDHTKTIVSIIGEMTTALLPYAEAGDSEAKGIIAVHNAWANLLTSKGTPQEQTVLAKQLDSVWMTQAPADEQNTIQILYPMESYQDIFQKLVEWDYVVMFKDKRYEDENKRAAELQRRMVALFESSDSPLAGNDAMRLSIPKVAGSRSVIYAQMGGGTSLGFLPAASNNPNNADQRQHGSKIRQNMETIKQRAEIADKHLKLLFRQKDPGFIEQTFGTKQQRVTSIASEFVPLHEVAHNALILDDTTKRLTSAIHSNIEEAKADIFAVVTALSTLDTFEEKAAFVSRTFTENLRGLSRFADTVDRSHYYGDMLLIKLLMQANVLVKTQKGWDFQITPQALEAVLSGATNVLKDFGTVYNEGEANVAQQLATELFMNGHFEETPKIFELLVDSGIMSKEEYNQHILPLAS